jgi:hypothetical protein
MVESSPIHTVLKRHNISAKKKIESFINTAKESGIKAAVVKHLGEDLE